MLRVMAIISAKRERTARHRAASVWFKRHESFEFDVDKALGAR